MKNRNFRYYLIYGAMFAFIIVILAIAFFNTSGDSLTDELSDGRVAFHTGWTTRDGKPVNPARLNRIAGLRPYQKTGIYKKLPERIAEGSSLCFRSKNIFYQIYIDGELRYEPDIPVNSVYNASLGTRWTYAPLYSDDAGKQVEIRFHTVYANANACLDHFYLGQAAGEILTTFSDKIISFITCILLMFVSILLIVADIPINMQNRRNHELLYLGLFSLSITVWCISETNIFQFFTNDSRFVQLISCFSLMMIPIPMVLYLDAAFGFEKHIVVSGICYLSAGEFLLNTLLHFSGILDYHDTLFLTHILLGLSAFTLLVVIIKPVFSDRKQKKRTLYSLLRSIGLCSLSLALVIDLIRYYLGHSKDSAMFMRIGLFLFIICYGCSSLERTINAVQLGVHTKFVRQLAYQDGLTGIGNRTAFQEKLEELEKTKTEFPYVGIMMFDVNDLKYVNDNIGHQTGDDMLVCSADLIKKSVDTENGSCYRIGGDEFAAILSGENVPHRCDGILSCFKEKMTEYNAVDGQPFRLSIAGGYAVYDSSRPEQDLTDIFQLADKKMYENKKQQKESQLTPELYYQKRKPV